MKCKDYKILMMEFLYDEISEKDKTNLLAHLQVCKNCREEYHELKQVPGFLGQWKNEPAPVQITFTTETDSLWNRIQKIIPPFSIVKKIGLGFAALLFLLALFNTKIELKNGQFSFQTSLWKNSGIPQENISAEIMEQLRYENFKLTSQLLENYEAKNDKKTLMLLENVITEIRRERSEEYEKLIGTVNHAYQANDFRIQQTSHTVDEIIELLSEKSKNN
jgi:hypothetical protein